MEEERGEVQKDYDNLQKGKLTAQVDVYRNTLKEYYGPKPVYHEEFCGPESSKSYTREEFDQLQDYSKSVEGSGISGEEFTALSMFRAFDPEIGGKYDPEGCIGLTPEEVVSSNLSMFTDTVNGRCDRPRESHGKVFGWVVQPAREKTVEAIDEYKQGKCEKLGELIGRGIHTLANHYAGQEMGNALEAENLLSTDSPYMKKPEEKKTQEQKTVKAQRTKDLGA